MVFMTTSGMLQYDMLGYYLFVCLYDICDSDICSLYGSLLFYSTDIFDYDIYHCLLHMIYVLWLAIYSKLCRGVSGGGGGYTAMLFTPLHMNITNVHDPDLILLVYMLSE